MHPAIKNLLRHFTYRHLPEHLAKVSKPFCMLASETAYSLEGAEATACMRKLLEAKDCAVRAKIDAMREV